MTTITKVFTAALVLSAMTWGLPASAQTQPHAPSSVYRFYSAVDHNHFYTSSDAEAEALKSQNSHYQFEGIIGLIDPINLDSNNIAVYRLYHSVAKDHFYTTSAAERDAAVSQGYRSEGLLGYVDKIAQDEFNRDRNLHRLYSPATGNHFYTTNSAEKDAAIASLGYRYEGSLGFVLTPHQVYQQ